MANGMVAGAAATVVMTALMLSAVATGISPMPKPIPVALVSQTLGSLPRPAALGLGLIAHGTKLSPAIAAATLVLHLAYGGTLGALLGRRHANAGSTSS
jgi:hypothetical protein